MLKQRSVSSVSTQLLAIHSLVVFCCYFPIFGSSFCIHDHHQHQSTMKRSTQRFARTKNSDSEQQVEETSENVITTTKDVLGILFDIDGTLADSWKLGCDATNEVLKKNSIPLITEQIYHEHTRYCTPDRLARHAGLAPDDPNFNTVGEKLGNEFDNLYVGMVNQDTAPFYHGISDLLQGFPDTIKLGALTNACVEYAYAVLKSNDHNESGLYSKFETIHGADSVPKPKPAPDGLFQCCAEIGLSPSQCVYIGDSPSDAEAAKAAGMISIGVLWGSHSESKVRAAPFDHVCSSVDELKNLLPFKNHES